MLLHLHSSPFWLLLLAYAPSNLSSYSNVIPHQILTSTWPSCDEPHFITYHCLTTPVPSNNMLGTHPLSRLIRLPCGQFSRTASIELDDWPSLHHAAANGGTPSPWLHVEQDFTQVDSKAAPYRVNLCEAHVCSCGTPADAKNSHGLYCKRNSGRSISHHQLNDLIWRAIMRARMPLVKEPAGLFRSDGKHPDGLSHRNPCPN